jgi:hypothetical protein
MSYVPRLDDYVVWKDSLGRVIEGWVYFSSEYYITIEISVRDKPPCEYASNDKHKKIHCLVLCFPENYHELEYVKSRSSVV